jgi:hypothetical protein
MLRSTRQLSVASLRSIWFVNFSRSSSQEVGAAYRLSKATRYAAECIADGQKGTDALLCQCLFRSALQLRFSSTRASAHHPDKSDEESEAASRRAEEESTRGASSSESDKHKTAESSDLGADKFYLSPAINVEPSRRLAQIQV